MKTMAVFPIRTFTRQLVSIFLGAWKTLPTNRCTKSICSSCTKCIRCSVGAGCRREKGKGKEKGEGKGYGEEVAARGRV